MARVVVIGAGIAGLTSALFLARDGHQVLICERDPGPPEGGLEALWSEWRRPSVPHGRLGHGFLPGFSAELRRRAPDVLEEIARSRVTTVDLMARAPEGSSEPEDVELFDVLCRRPVLEGIIRRSAEREPGVTVRSECVVSGLVAEPGSPPAVTGVHLADGEVIAADVVVIAGGRRLPLAKWLEAIGAGAPSEASEGCGQLWYTRYNRLELPDHEADALASSIDVIDDLGFMFYSFLAADAGTFCYELGIPVSDRSLRPVHEQSVFMAVIDLMPEAGEWLRDGRSTPVGDMCAMGQERNLVRVFPREGAPLALGMHVIGDARGRTNSLYAWGASLAIQQAGALTDALREHPGDPAAQAWALEAAVADEVDGRCRASRFSDRAWLRRLGLEQPEDGDPDMRLIHEVLEPAAKLDRQVYRGLARWTMCLRSTRSLLDDADLTARARAALAERRPPDKEPRETPGRDDVLAAIHAVPAGSA